MGYKKSMGTRALVGLVVVNLTLAEQQQQPGDALRVVVLEGDGAINNIRSPHTKETVVRVDTDNQAAAGAAVTFLLPAEGAGGYFADGARSLTLTTDDRGLAAARGLHANRIAGAFLIRITASLNGRTATAAITQTNVDPGAQATSHKIAILALVGGAAAAGAAVALRGGKSSSPSPSPTPSVATVIVPGTPVFGAPH